MTHAEQIADRVSVLIVQLELFLSKDAERARRKQAEQLLHREQIRAVRKEKIRDQDETDDDDDTEYAFWLVGLDL